MEMVAWCIKKWFNPLSGKAGGKMKTHYRPSGQIVIIMLIIAMIIGVVIPGLIFLTQHEAKWTVKEIKSTRAFHLAEAGLDRGVFKLDETGVWDIAYAGTVISGYDGNTTYSDVEGGYYKIKFSTGSGNYEITITASGKDKTTNEMRTIQAVYYAPPGVIGAMNAPSIAVTGHVRVHWGSTASLSNMVLSGSTDVKYPRKYARGYIDPRTLSPNPASGSDLTLTEELREWHAGYAVPDLPSIDFSSYTAMAQQVTGAPSGGTPAGSSYYVGDKTFNNVVDTTKRTYYITGNCTMKNSHLESNLIVLGNFDTSGSDKGSAIISTVPSEAWKEYQELPDTAASGEYPADNGYQSVSATYDIGKTLFNGFIYVSGNWTPTGGNNFNGCVIVAGSVSGAGTPTIYYDEAAARNIAVTSIAKPTRQSWKELSPRWSL
ncbi:MAG: hypothetical protein V1833_03910 [Elusimicrobiota bacterium]